MEYLNALKDLHLKSVDFLELIQNEKNKICDLGQRQNNFKNTFGRISPQFAQEILVAKRKIKILNRSYFKISDQINNLKLSLTFIQLDN
jgi:hypothetical protein